jgi:hypothetical protein
MTAGSNGLQGGCHCGAVRFEVALADGFQTVRRCNCSYCRMRGAIAVSAPIENLHILEGKEALTSYRFNTKTAEHFFCSRCGIYTHHQRRSDPTVFGVNVACLDGVSPFDFLEIPVTDGVHHSKDNDGIALVAGTLRFEPAEPGRPLLS